MRPTREKTGKRENGAAYFVSTQTTGRKPFFRHEPWARLMAATLNHYAERDFILHAWVIMPDHLHLLITPAETLEKSVQLIKGGFSFRAKRELDWKFDIWQPGFADHRIRDEEDWKRHLEYIRANPADARLVQDSVVYEFLGFPNSAFPQGLKPQIVGEDNVRAKARTLHVEARPLHPDPAQAATHENVKGAGFSPSIKADFSTGALAPEGGKR
jgi:putative transposase